MTIFDTNVMSETVRQSPSHTVLSWIHSLDPANTFITSVTEAELLYGIEKMPLGRQRVGTSAAVERMLARFGGRILPFDESAAPEYAKIVAARERLGRPIQPLDAAIAAIVRSRAATLATRDTADFADCGIRVVNPWEG
jgi:hypothetical protein